MSLTERQRKDMHEAILDYLLADGLGFSKTAAVFKEEGKLETNTCSGKGLLEKKWTSVVRLQKKVLELESQLALARTDAASRPGGAAEETEGGGSSGTSQRGLPKGPTPKGVLSGHRGPVTSVAVHPVYSLVASGSEDASVKIWDYESQLCERTLKGHTQAVTAVVFDPAGKLLATCSLDLSAKLWDLSTYNCTKTLRGHEHTISSLQFLPSSDSLITCSRDQSLKLWEVATGFCTRTFSGAGDWIRCVSVSQDGAMVAGGCSDHTIGIWYVTGGKMLQTLRGHEHVVECVCFGRRPLVSKLIEGQGQGQGQEGPMSGSTSASSSSAEDFGYLASGSRDRSVKLWDALKGVCLMTFSAHENWVRSVLMHPSGKYIISTSDDKTIRVMDIKEQRCLRTIAEAHAHFVTDVAVNSRNSVYITASVDQNLAVWGTN